MDKQMNAQIDRPIATLASHVNDRAELKLCGSHESCLSFPRLSVHVARWKGHAAGLAASQDTYSFFSLLRSGYGHTLSSVWCVQYFSSLVLLI